MEKQLSLRRAYLVVILDAVALVALYYMPAMSHMISVPLYLFEPMRIILFCLVLFSKGNRINSYIMAFTLPLFSFFVVGHPIFAKSLLMSAELFLNVALLYLLIDKTRNNGVSVFISICARKLFYYLTKYFLVLCGLLSSSIISTNIFIQLIIALLISGVFVLVDKKRV